MHLQRLRKGSNGSYANSSISKFFEPLDIEQWNKDKATTHFAELSDMTDTDYILACMRLNNPTTSYTKEK